MFGFISIKLEPLYECEDVRGKASRVPPAYNMTGSLTLQRELISVVYVFIHDVVIMAGHTSDKCTAGLSCLNIHCFISVSWHSES